MDARRGADGKPKLTRKAPQLRPAATSEAKLMEPARKRSIVIACGVLLVVAGILAIAFFSRSAPKEAHPAGYGKVADSNEPSARTSASSSPRSRLAVVVHAHGNAVATNTPATNDRPELSERFKGDKTCYDSMIALAAARHIVEYCRSPGRSPEPRSVAECRRIDAMFPRGNPTLADIAGRYCPGSDQLAAWYFDSMYAAALAGDVDAQYCFIDRDNGRFTAAEPDLDAADFEQLDQDELRWARDAFQRGDWRIVAYVTTHLAAHSNSSGLVPALPGLEAAGDDFHLVEYSLGKLLRLGATGRYAQRLDEMLLNDTVNNPNIPPGDLQRSGVLNAADQAAADAWAKAAFEQYFADSPAQSSEPKVCDNPYLATVLGH